MKVIRTFVVVAAAALALAGCSGASGAASGSAAPSVTSSLGPTEAAPAAVTSIVIAGDGLHLYVGKTERELVRYTDPAASALAAVEDAVGPSTGSKDIPGTNHTAPSTAHQFGDLWITVPVSPGASAPDLLLHPAWTVSTTVAEVAGVRLTASSGITIGSSIDSVPGHDDPDRVSTFTANGAVSAFLLVEASPGSRLVPTATGTAVGVLAGADPWPGPITSLSAPSQYGGA